MKQLLGAMTYCHVHNVVHRDLKPENILIDSIVESKINVKIIDFGTALICPPNIHVKGGLGTVYYIAPEVIQGRCTAKCDVWSLGVIMYILLSGKVPFNGKTDEEIFASILAGNFFFSDPIWETISEEAKDLIFKMLTYNENARISAGQAFMHPWFKKCIDISRGSRKTQDLLSGLKEFQVLN